MTKYFHLLVLALVRSARGAFSAFADGHQANLTTPDLDTVTQSEPTDRWLYPITEATNDEPVDEERGGFTELMEKIRNGVLELVEKMKNGFASLKDIFKFKAPIYEFNRESGELVKKFENLVARLAWEISQKFDKAVEAYTFHKKVTLAKEILAKGRSHDDLLDGQIPPKVLYHLFDLKAVQSRPDHPTQREIDDYDFLAEYSSLYRAKTGKAADWER
uniref:Uncharacterized protein n=1 Tax=Peronospora matthiolae TaxID=2874970 RepID=A0AAV1TSB1_9STRA